MVGPRYGRRRERGLLVALSHLLSELRYPTTRRAKIIVVILAITVFSVLCLGIVGGFVLSNALLRPAASESIDPTTFLANVENLEFPGPDGKTRRGWFFPGLRNGPIIVVCHGYRSSRAEILTLATSLQQHRYNVFTFNFAGHGESPVSYTTLGYKETEELKAALDMLALREDIDTDRMGVWGYSLGAYAALQAAASSPHVKAVVIDSAYTRPTQLLRLELDRTGAGALPVIPFITILEFRILSVLFPGQESGGEALKQTTGLPKLFLTAETTEKLAAMTEQLFNEAPGPKDLRELPRTNLAVLVEEERREYENLVISFFMRRLPLS